MWVTHKNPLWDFLYKPLGGAWESSCVLIQIPAFVSHIYISSKDGSDRSLWKHWFLFLFFLKVLECSQIRTRQQPIPGSWGRGLCGGGQLHSELVRRALWIWVSSSLSERRHAAGINQQTTAQLLHTDPLLKYLIIQSLYYSFTFKSTLFFWKKTPSCFYCWEIKYHHLYKNIYICWVFFKFFFING